MIYVLIEPGLYEEKKSNIQVTCTFYVETEVGGSSQCFSPVV